MNGVKWISIATDIFNDETTRKYLQSVKRLITYCQYKYPVDPSHSVEWNAFNNW